MTVSLSPLGEVSMCQFDRTGAEFMPLCKCQTVQRIDTSKTVRSPHQERRFDTLTLESKGKGQVG